MLERQRERIARPKAEGKYKGRAKTAMVQAGEVEARLSDGISSTEVAKRLKIERGGVYRAIRLRNIKRQPTSIGGRAIPFAVSPSGSAANRCLLEIAA